MNAAWMFDERQHAGQEHLDPDEAARFDEKLPFDPSSEVELLLEFGLTEMDTIVDFGTGTGAFPLAIADHCARVIAVDISEAMLDIVTDRIAQQGVENIETVNSGFLSYKHRGPLASYAFSKDALHHLPDFWKIEALKTVAQSLEPGGIFRLRDFVYSFDPLESYPAIDSWLEAHKHSTKFTDEELYRHVKAEFGTYGFLLESMLEVVGFTILAADYEGKYYAEYTCRWDGTLN